MIKNKLYGWKDVFSFTINQTTKGKSFKVSTLLFALLVFGIVCVINVVMAATGDADKVSPVKTVHVLDESGLSRTDFSPIASATDSAYSGVGFQYATEGTTEEALLKDIQDINSEVILHITKEENGYGMRISIPAGSSISKSDGEALLNQLVPFFKFNKLMQIGLTEKQLESINKGVTTSFITAGEPQESIGETLIKIFVPMIFSFVLYMMLILYGQTICKSLVTEKSSKLMELLLTSATPYALISGKILAMTLIAITQFIVWIGSGIAGFMVGSSIAKSMYPEYHNSILTIFNLIKDNTNADAFSIPACILAVVVLCLGFLFYSVLAGMVGAILNKVEDLSHGMAIFTIPVVISFMLAYLLPLQSNGKGPMLEFIRYFPFTSPFSLPADLIIGNINVLGGSISLVILILSTLVLMMITGKLYKGMVLYNGDKVSAKFVINVLKTK